MLQQLLDDTHARVLAGDVVAATNDLAQRLSEIRLAESDDHWFKSVQPTCLAHPIDAIYSQDPYTRRAREKPRGYAGDAVMLDYVYFNEAPVDLPPLAKEVFYISTNTLAGKAVVWRSRFLGQEIDNAAERTKKARVLSLACGHLRETLYSQHLNDGQVEAIFAVDQDPESLAVVQREQDPSRVRTHLGSVRNFLKGEMTFPDLHLAYAAGLFDYLPEPAAQGLTVKLFTMLAPGGKLLVPNFLKTYYARGYMESFMDWHLIVRDRAGIERLGALVPPRQVASSRYFEDPYGVVGYLELVRG